MADVQVEPLYPPHLADLPVAEFMDKLPTLDAALAEKAAAAAAEGKVLRYVADVSFEGRGKLTVGLQAVPADSPLGTLTGSDNLVEVRTERVYRDAPLVLRGAGAGAESTAAGVLSDMIELAAVDPGS